MMQDDDDDDDDNDDPMILNNRAKNHTSERTIVPWTVIFVMVSEAMPVLLDLISMCFTQMASLNKPGLLVQGF